jgi:ABC-type glycerol-3-phosphate transport system permease component
MWRRYHFAVYFLNSIVISTSTALIATFVGALAGYGFSRFKFHGKTFILGAFLATQMISGAVIIGSYFKILVALGLYNTRLGLVIAYITICLPFCAWMAKGYFDTIPQEIDQAARVDGCTQFQCFLLVISPLAIPGMVATMLFSFLLAWQDLLWAMTLTATEAIRTVIIGLSFFVGEFQVNWPVLMAAALVASLPSVMLYLFLQKALVRGLTAGAVKQ